MSIYCRLITEELFGNGRRDSCFAPATLIHTPNGCLEIARLKQGDLVTCMAGGLQMNLPIEEVEVHKNPSSSYGATIDFLIGDELIRSTPDHTCYLEDGRPAWLSIGSRINMFATESGPRRIDVIDSASACGTVMNLRINTTIENVSYLVGRSGLLASDRL